MCTMGCGKKRVSSIKAKKGIENLWSYSVSLHQAAGATNSRLIVFLGESEISTVSVEEIRQLCEQNEEVRMVFVLDSESSSLAKALDAYVADKEVKIERFDRVRVLLPE